MRVTEQLLRESQKQKQKKQQRQSEEEEEETLTYMPYPVAKEPLNRQGGVFTRTETSFHTQESVFDRTAVFDTRVRGV